MNQEVSTFSTGLRYGLIASVISIVLGLIFYLSGLTDFSNGKPSAIFNWIPYIVYLACTIMAIKYFKESNGSLSIGEGLGTSFYTGLTIGIITAIWTYIFMSFIAPDLGDLIKEVQMEEMLANGMSEEQLEQTEGIMDAMMSPGMLSATIVVFSILFTFIVGLVASLIMKEEANPLA